jgi:hypothetical protein
MASLQQLAPRRAVPRSECARSACLVWAQGFRYARLVDLSEHGASFVIEGDPVVAFEKDLQVLLEMDDGEYVHMPFRRVWTRGRRLGGAWSRFPLRGDVLQQLSRSGPEQG